VKTVATQRYQRNRHFQPRDTVGGPASGVQLGWETDAGPNQPVEQAGYRGNADLHIAVPRAALTEGGLVQKR